MPALANSTGYTALNYRGGYGSASLAAAMAKQLYCGSAAVLAHANGITLSQPLNDTVVLVKAPGAGGVKVENQTGVRTDWRGMPSRLMPLSIAKTGSRWIPTPTMSTLTMRWSAWCHPWGDCPRQLYAVGVKIR